MFEKFYESEFARNPKNLAVQHCAKSLANIVKEY